MKSWHVYIARGPNSASADIRALDKDDAKERGSKLWSEPVANLSAHLISRCFVFRCDG